VWSELCGPVRLCHQAVQSVAGNTKGFHRIKAMQSGHGQREVINSHAPLFSARDHHRLAFLSSPPGVQVTLQACLACFEQGMDPDREYPPRPRLRLLHRIPTVAQSRAHLLLQDIPHYPQKRLTPSGPSREGHQPATPCPSCLAPTRPRPALSDMGAL
jgi:hypothetical protein